jgi:hypothetical protein
MTLERRAQALLELVEGDRCTQCDAILAEAGGRAGALVAQARGDARARVREVFAEERKRAQESVAAARAKLQTLRRLHEQQRTAAMLALGWQRLPDALRQRWQDDAKRRLWSDAILAVACRVLPPGRWQVTHASAWPVAEREAFAARIAQQVDGTPAFAADAGIDAGLRIATGGNVVDGTLGGLVNDRMEVGARLLRFMEQQP